MGASLVSSQLLLSTILQVFARWGLEESASLKHVST
eukprot:CAMPEP_0171060276 /NCGR_PEP_ID=MMETSP0766_2-20121228/3734_1 /TAXON_ID=439317 /ORGANISM="Gambierdiscus australes, Strain CAWD 149" /LENGTH=35 /DNA_ID= /DNA_START= /DNA_END= /DNA_ORIENTATION=